MAANIVAYALVQTSKNAESRFLSEVTKGMPLWSTYMFLKDQVKDDDSDYDNGGDDGDNITHEEAK